MSLLLCLLIQVSFEQRLGAQVPVNLVFREDSGVTIRLGALLRERPAVLALVYYRCPRLCNEVLNGLYRAWRVLNTDCSVIAVSFDPCDTPEDARAKKLAYRVPWHFLTGDPTSIDALTRAVGFRFEYDPKTGQFSHASGIVVLTPAGRVARYLYGIEYSARDLRLALVEASGGVIGSPVEQLLLLCFAYDPSAGKYRLAVLNILRAAGVVTVLVLATFVARHLIREHRRR